MRKTMLRLTGAAIFTLMACAQTAPPYYLVFLRPAADRKALSKEEGERIQTAHMANIRSMADRGLLAAAGPFGDTPTTITGIFVMKAGSVDEARRIAAEDPTVREHRNTAEVVVWRGPAGIGDEYFRLHKADPKTPEDMGVQPFCMLYRGGNQDSALLRGHTAYVDSLRREGKVAASGDVEDGGDLMAILVLNRMPDEEARRLANEDPAVKGGALRVEYHRWWSAAHVLPGR